MIWSENMFFLADVADNERILGFNISGKVYKILRSQKGIVDSCNHKGTNYYTILCFVEIWNAEITYPYLPCHYGLDKLKFYRGNQWRPAKWEKWRLFTLSCLQQEGQSLTLVAESQKQAEKWECLIVEKRRDFRCALIGGCWHRKPRWGN